MAEITKHYSYFKLLFFIIISLIAAAIFHIQGVAAGSRTTPLMPISSVEMNVQRTSSANQETNFREEGRRIEKKKNRKRLMIGSVAPTCTYNECRGCKYKCRAEQVPVEGNDPINSAYHYKCVCHRHRNKA